MKELMHSIRILLQRIIILGNQTSNFELIPIIIGSNVYKYAKNLN